MQKFGGKISHFNTTLYKVPLLRAKHIKILEYAAPD